jgi:hypothetical protein
MFSKTVFFLTFISASLVFTPASHAKRLEQGDCVVLHRVDVQGAMCKALLQNECAHPASVSVNYKAKLYRFIPNVFPRRDRLHMDHHGEPAWGHEEEAGVRSSTEQGALSAGQSKWFEQTAPGHMIRVSSCRVSYNARWPE